MTLSVIIVSYNTSRLLISCLDKVIQSLNYANLLSECEVIVIDNNSADDSVQLISRKFPKIRLIQNRSNLGFAKANNQGIRISKGKYLLFLNSDTEVEKESLGKMVQILAHDQRAGVLGPRMLNKDHTLQPSAGFLPHLLKVFFWMFFIDDLPLLDVYLKPYHVENFSFYQKKQYVDWVSGACFLVKKEVLEKTGLFDEKIFMYAEEVELCYRIRSAGYLVLYHPDIKIIHLKGESGSGLNSGLVEEFRGLIRLYEKYKPDWQTNVLRRLLYLGALLRITVFGIIKGRSDKARLYDEAIKMVG